MLEGVGFLCSVSNSLLTISNSVSTRLPKPGRSSGTNVSAVSIVNAPDNPSNCFLIFSRSCDLDYDTNQIAVTYYHDVLVVDSNMQMRCEYLRSEANTNRLDTNTTIKTILAQTNVTLLTSDQGEAWGDQALCTTGPDGEHVELTGHAHWKDGPRETFADKFTFDFTDQYVLTLVHAYGNAVLKLPDSELKSTNVSGLPMRNLGGGSNQFTYIYADTVTVKKTAKDLESILADGHVVMTNEAEHTRATGQSALYTKAKDLLELSGDAVLHTAAKGEISGDILSVNRTNQAASAHGHARLTLYLPKSAETRLLRLQGAGSAEETNLLLVVNSQNIVYRTNLAVFTGDVDAQLLQGGQWLGTINSQRLEVGFDSSNHVQSVLASNQVRAVTAQQGLVRSRKMAADFLFARFWPGTPLLQEAKAEGAVWGEQVVEDKASRQTKTSTFNSDLFTAKFDSKSNLVEQATAQGRVRASQATGVMTNLITGQRAIYMGTTNQFVNVTGKPEWFYNGPLRGGGSTANNAAQTGKIEAPALENVVTTGADILIWDMKDGSVRLTGPYKVVPTTQTNNAPKP